MNTTRKTSAHKTVRTEGGRPHRVSTAAVRAKTIKVVAAKGKQPTVYETLKAVWSARGEILTDVKGGILMELKKADVVRTLKSLPRDAKSPFTLKLVDKQHILA